MSGTRLVPPVASIIPMVVLVAACGQSFTRAVAVESFGEANPDATEEQSACVVDALIDGYGLDQLELELEAEQMSAAFEEDQFRSMFRCGLEGDVAAQITEQLEDAGVEPADAPCVADGLVDDLTDADIDVLLSGEITDEFSTKFLEAMDACGALNP